MTTLDTVSDRVETLWEGRSAGKRRQVNVLCDDFAEKFVSPKRVLTSVSDYTSVYSDDRVLEMIMMAYAGLRNSRLVEHCQRVAVNAIGLTGLDGLLIRGRRNRGICIRNNDKTMIEQDRSGKPVSINGDLLRIGARGSLPEYRSRL